MKAKWAGQTVVVIASGPSLTQADCDLVERSGLTTIAVNCAWEYARFCDAIYAGDLAWWAEYSPGIDITAEKYTLSANAASVFGLIRHVSKRAQGYNSGLLAIEMACHFGAEKVLMLGFDASVENGIHFHGRHESLANPDPRRCGLWLGYFEALAKDHKNIINCSRQTALTCFPRQSLESALESVAKPSLYSGRAGEGIHKRSAGAGLHRAARGNAEAAGW